METSKLKSKITWKHVRPKQELFLLNRTTLLITDNIQSIKNINNPRAIEISLHIHQKTMSPDAVK